MSTTVTPGNSHPAAGAAAVHGAANGASRASAINGLVSAAQADAQSVVDGTAVESRSDEHFLPVTRYALVDRLTHPQAWAPGVAGDVRRFFRYLDYWRQQRHAVNLMRLHEMFEPFSPDSDLFVTRQYTEAERRDLQAGVVQGMSALIERANYILVPRNKIAAEIMSKESHYGLDLKVDFDAFDELFDPESCNWDEYFFPATHLGGDRVYCYAMLDDPPVDIEFDAETSNYTSYLDTLDNVAG